MDGWLSMVRLRSEGNGREGKKEKEGIGKVQDIGKTEEKKNLDAENFKEGKVM